MTDSSAHFDLRTEPWIPLVDGSGRRVELGIRETLARAHELREIVDASPLVEVALHRLLLALLHRVVDGPRSPDAWQRLWELGRFEESPLDDYLDRLADRFDLFGADRPFYQCRGLIAAGVKTRPIVRLTHELASEGNSALLFDHTLDSGFRPGRAARAIIAQQTFALGGLMTPSPGSTDKSSIDAPAARSALFRVRGRTLFESLMANLVRYDPISGVPVAGDRVDVPSWERDRPPDGASRPPTGYLDVLTWQSRRIELEAPGSDGLVAGAAMISGDRIPGGRDLWAIEPTMLAFVTWQPKTGPVQKRALRMSTDRSLWRDSTALVAGAATDSGRQRPMAIEWAAELAALGLGGRGETSVVSADATGLVADQAKTLLWRRESMSLPVIALRDPAIAEQVRSALTSAERIGAMLGDGRDETASGAGSLPRPLARIAMRLLGTNERRPRSEAIQAFVRATGAAPRYWAALADPFARLLTDLAGATAASDPDDERAAAIDRWHAALRHAARDAFVRATSGLGGSTRALLAVADGESAFNLGLVRVLGAPRRPVDQEVAPA